MQHHVFPIKNRNLKLIRVINAYPKNFTLFLIKKKKKRIIKRKIRFNAIIKSNFILNIFIFRIIFFNFLLQSFLSISLHISSTIKKNIHTSQNINRYSSLYQSFKYRCLFTFTFSPILDWYTSNISQVLSDPFYKGLVNRFTPSSIHYTPIETVFALINQRTECIIALSPQIDSNEFVRGRISCDWKKARISANVKLHAFSPILAEIFEDENTSRSFPPLFTHESSVVVVSRWQIVLKAILFVHRSSPFRYFFQLIAWLARKF